MSELKVTFRLSDQAARLPETVTRNLVHKILPRAVSNAVPIVREAIIENLPDGQAGENTRAKQSATTKARFPYHLKDRVRVKHVGDDRGILKIVGVDSKGSHVNFDHGEKAMTQGRVHKLWWIKGIRERYHTPKLRKQTQDIPKIVQRQVGDRVEKVMADTVVAAVRSGELI